MKNILFAASECAPFVKTGGLADVIGSLPKNFDHSAFDVRVVLPKYTFIDQKWKDALKYQQHFYMELAGRDRYVGILKALLEGVTYYFIDNEHYFSGATPYEGDGRWNIEKFSFFSKAVLSILPVIGFRPDLIHCHDWQTGLIPVYLDNFRYLGEYYRGIKTMMTIHNMRFQGVWDKEEVKSLTGLPDYYFAPDKLEAYGSADLLKGGIIFSDKITTVSPSYAKEIKTRFYGEKLDGLMRARSDSLYGILNGVDYSIYSPSSDPMIVKNYTAEDFRKAKSVNKRALQKELGLAKDPKIIMIGIVSRLTEQKGFDLIQSVMDELCREKAQLVVLGTGEEKYEEMFRYFARKYPETVSANIFYSDALSHRIYASCDAFLMPSLFEPCGLSQLIALRYGTVPIVRETGGLKDTVEAYNEFKKIGTGFSFLNYHAREMLNTIRYAQHVYYDTKRDWNKIAQRGMAMDFSWKNSAKAYEALYHSLTDEEKGR